MKVKTWSCKLALNYINFIMSKLITLCLNNISMIKTQTFKILRINF